MDCSKFKISAFADEFSPDFSRQLDALIQNNLHYIEIRGVNGKNISSLSKSELLSIKKQLDVNRIKVSSIGSPIGKISISDDFNAHLNLLDNTILAANLLETNYIRIFSFYIPKGQHDLHRNDVLSKMERMFEAAHKHGITLCHENERGIYGESPEHCLDIMNHFNGRIKLVFDHANFITGGFQPYPHAFNLLADHIEYLHIKDASDDGIMPAGKGNGRIPETLTDLFARGYDNFLTVEPHLAIFNGVDDLEHGENTLVKNKFRSNEDAFNAAVAALMDILSAL